MSHFRLLKMVMLVFVTFSCSNDRFKIAMPPDAIADPKLTGTQDISLRLNNEGLDGWIHGAVHDIGMYVFTFRNKDFFDATEFSLIPTNREQTELLFKLNRHDKVRVKGQIAASSKYQQHILISDIKLLEAWKSPEGYSHISYATEVPNEVRNQDAFIATVHFASPDGRILVVDYKDFIIPVRVPDPNLIKGIYRNDLIAIHYRVAKSPAQQLHLVLDNSLESQGIKAVEVFSPIASMHEKPLVIEGVLAQFAKSPQVLFDVYALEVKTTAGRRTWTLVNFENPDVFLQIRDKLDQLWKQDSKNAVQRRNYRVNTNIKLKVSGIGNVVSPVQANPQILLKSADLIEVIK